MTTKEKPDGFEQSIPVSGVIIRVGDEILLLKRAPYKKYGANQWALVAGKSDVGESLVETAQRELFEELGIEVEAGDLKMVQTYYHSPNSDPQYKIIWNVFSLSFEEKPDIILNKEHTEYAWAHKNKVMSYDLIDGESYCLNDYFLDH